MDSDKIRQVGINIGVFIVMLWIYPTIVSIIFLAPIMSSFSGLTEIHYQMVHKPETWSTDPNFSIKKKVCEFLLYFVLDPGHHQRSYHSIWDDSWGAGISLLLTFIVGIIIGPVGIFLFIKYLRARSWPYVTGEITESWLRYRHIKIRQFRGGGYVYVPNIEYKYTVNGKEYTGNKITYIFMVKSNIECWMQKIVDKYPIGSEQKIYYNPKDPEKCLLDNKKLSGLLLLLTLTGFLILLAALIYPSGYFFVKFF